MAPAGLEFRTIDYQDIITERPDILDTDEDLPEFSPNHQEAYVVRSLSRSALRMLWHQRLGHINFRRLSEMHRFVKGMPQFKLPTELEECPICLAAKLRKTPKGTGTTMRATTCNQGLSIDFGFMVQKSRDSIRHNTLVGLNGETCYVLLTDHFSGRIFGRAFPTKAPPVDWINSWIAIRDLVRIICSEDSIDLRDEGVLGSFNGVDVEQCDRYIKITCESYIGQTARALWLVIFRIT
ncbi:hypothetical protein MHU86_2333 [Fragilaria crotonensis]|nr:hypothetical protein MHU86_2333 [Fragilaria crotonensis]